MCYVFCSPPVVETVKSEPNPVIGTAQHTNNAVNSPVATTNKNLNGDIITRRTSHQQQQDHAALVKYHIDQIQPAADQPIVIPVKDKKLIKEVLTKEGASKTEQLRHNTMVQHSGNKNRQTMGGTASVGFDESSEVSEWKQCFPDNKFVFMPTSEDSNE